MPAYVMLVKISLDILNNNMVPFTTLFLSATFQTRRWLKEESSFRKWWSVWKNGEGFRIGTMWACEEQRALSSLSATAIIPAGIFKPRKRNLFISYLTVWDCTLGKGNGQCLRVVWQMLSQNRDNQSKGRETIIFLTSVGSGIGHF